MIPLSATTNVNVRSLTSALRDIALLAERGVDPGENLRMLADRVEEMYHEEQERLARG